MFLNKLTVSRFLLEESKLFCSPDQKIAFANAWIQGGRSFPDKSKFEDPILMDPARMIREDRSKLWSNFADKNRAKIREITNKALLDEKSFSSKILVDLGGGNSDLALYMLTKDWQVTVVDSCSKSLRNLEKRVKNSAKLGLLNEANLKLECKPMEEYQFPERVSLVAAQNSFPYCNPAKLEEVMERIYHSLEPKGNIAGNLFEGNWKDNQDDREFALRVDMGAWLATETLARDLLSSQGFKIKSFDKKEGHSISEIEFIGQKE